MRLIGRWAFMRVPMMEARQRLDDAFRGVPEEERDARWEARYADINRCVIDVYGKEALKKDQVLLPGLLIVRRKFCLTHRACRWSG